MLAKFTLYDFIAVIIPGIFLLWALGSFAGISELRAVSFAGSFADASVFIVIGYVAGLLLHAVGEQVTEKIVVAAWGGFPSGRWLFEHDSRFSPEYRNELWATLERKFGFVRQTEAGIGRRRAAVMRRNQEIFYRCYRYVEKVSEMPQIFNAQYGLFRSLLTTFTLLLVIAIGVAVMRAVRGLPFQTTQTRDIAVLTICAVVSYWRMKRRADDFARSVYDAFLASCAN